MNKTSIYIIILIVIAAIGLWLWMSRPATAPTSATPQGNISAGNDTAAAINQDLNNITVEDPNFQAIDSDLNSL